MGEGGDEGFGGNPAALGNPDSGAQGYWVGGLDCMGGGLSAGRRSLQTGPLLAPCLKSSMR